MPYYINNYIDNVHKIFTAFLLIMVVAGCGFHLRGNYNFAPIMHKVCISPDEPLEPLQKNLRRALQRNRIDTNISSVQSAEVVNLQLNQPVFTEEVLATNADAKNQRIRLMLAFTYSLKFKDQYLRELTNVTVSRDIMIDPSSPLTAETERRIVKDELIKEGTNQLLRQLTTVRHD